jgi:hypothetical protein
VQTVGKGDKVDSGNGEISVPERLTRAGVEGGDRSRESTIKWDVPTPTPATPRRSPEPSTPGGITPDLAKGEQRKEPESPRRSLLRRLSMKRTGMRDGEKSPV